MLVSLDKLNYLKTNKKHQTFSHTLKQLYLWIIAVIIMFSFKNSGQIFYLGRQDRLRLVLGEPALSHEDMLQYRMTISTHTHKQSSGQSPVCVISSHAHHN